MVSSKFYILIITIFSFSSSIQAQDLGIEKMISSSKNELTPFAIENTPSNIEVLKKKNIQIKYQNNKWIYFNVVPTELNSLIKDNSLSNIYFEHYPPSLMNDTARAHHFVDSVHIGTGGLDRPYTGSGVILGIVDTGIDVNHPDFRDSTGKTKVLRYWDHSIPPGGYSPQPYGYGYVWDSTAINNGFCTSNDATTHGSTVAGIAAGSGMANGTNYGMSPDADLIVVETNFGLSNWTLTIADACDYIFKVADSLGKPCVINLSLGTYIGSHDGNDPASQAIEQLLDEKPGRIVVAAAGNSGEAIPYHVRNDIGVTDTSFVWLKSNPTGYFGPNTVYFDLWSDLDQDDWDYFVAVDREIPNLSEGGRTQLRNAQDNVGTIFYDTIRNESGNMLCSMQLLSQIVDGAFNLQLLLKDCDSSLTEDYLYRFATSSGGSYDLWSGEFSDLSEIFSTPLSPTLYPNIVNYRYPDSLQSIVSSWNCSEKVVSVANMKNRITYIDKNLNNYTSSSVPVGKLSNSSSKGPNRAGVIKPDITAAGEIALSASTMDFLGNSANNSAIDSAGWHSRNGGTSMAAPVVAGIAGLYLERCPLSTYQDFLNDLKATGYEDNFTGTTPNNAYGYGKAHALDLLLNMDVGPLPEIAITGSMQISSTDAESYQWYLNGEPLVNAIDQDLILYETTGSYQVEIVNSKGCTLISDPSVITLSLDENDLNRTIYPNPTSSKFNILSEGEVQIEMFDILGNKVNIEEIGNQSYSIKHLSSGVYTLIIHSESHTSKSKLIKL